MPPSKKAQPKELITYLCTRCRWDFARTENDKPKCTLCGKTDRLKEIARQPMSPQALEGAMMRSMERLMTGLEGAYEAQQTQRGSSTREDEKKNDDEEILLLEAMVKAKNLQKNVEKAFGKGKRVRTIKTKL
ncbi:MAG: hypothetical protein HOO67_04490 [Candidatus Peribacteraceae bacterium]|nr:hypothetical protein [Candidatus Peribacteraceae bacterium]